MYKVFNEIQESDWAYQEHELKVWSFGVIMLTSTSIALASKQSCNHEDDLQYRMEAAVSLWAP